MIYVIVVTGYEGIEMLNWAGADREETIRRVQQLRDRLTKINARIEELQPKTELLQTAEGTLAYNAAEKRMWKALDAEFGAEWNYTLKPDHVCAQGYDPATDKFKCCCAELDVSPSKPMFR